MVFDGHGGWQVSEFVRKNLPKTMENLFAKALKENKNFTSIHEQDNVFLFKRN